MSNRNVETNTKPVRPQGFKAAFAIVKTIAAPTPLRWACHHSAGGSEIEAFVAARNGLETIANVRQMDGVNARANAELIVQAVNSYGKSQPLIAELVAALEFCMEAGKLTWAAEQEADAVCRKAKRVMGV